jgi:hypothetical protein
MRLRGLAAPAEVVIDPLGLDHGVGFDWLGIFIFAALVLATIYLLVIGIAAFEISNVTQPGFLAGYVKHLIASMIFLVLAVWLFRIRSRFAW